MQRLGRPAAIAATTLALSLAAAGSSIAAVRSDRQEGGITGAGEAAALPSRSRPDADGSQPPSTVGPDSTTPLPPTTFDPTAGLPPAEVPPTVPPSPSSSPAAPASASPAAAGVQLVGAAPQVMRSVAASASAPAQGPTPTTTPGRITSSSCPSDAGTGALPPDTVNLRAVNLTLPWPGGGPLLLIPQAGATRAVGALVSITGTTGGALAADGSSLTVTSPAALTYTLTAGRESARGSIRFTPVGLTVSVDRQACRDRSFTLYDVARASLHGSPLRVVGFVAPPGTVSVSADGGTVHFRAKTPGAYQVVLVTANDLGTAGSLLTARITVR